MAASINLTPEQRSQRARLAALARWSQQDPKKAASNGGIGLRAKFGREVDARAAERGETLTEVERERRVDVALRAHMTRLAFESSKARTARKAGEAA